MVLPFLAHIMCRFTTNFISFFLSHLYGCNAGIYVPNGAKLTELCYKYYASRTMVLLVPFSALYWVVLLQILYRSFRLIHTVVTQVSMSQAVQN
jgi:hypothetical protein